MNNIRPLHLDIVEKLDIPEIINPTHNVTLKDILVDLASAKTKEEADSILNMTINILYLGMLKLY